ncbi:hypothetical protein CUMW_148770 [Citrus unshiu]|nr:hypothetical protein CUMW_148770 [Citrus unshiu]
MAFILSMMSLAHCLKIVAALVAAQSSETQTEACHRNYGPLPLKRYNFSDVKKITNSFKDKLGQGGFGGVYKGKLLDGRSVAVKLLNASKGDG